MSGLFGGGSSTTIVQNTTPEPSAAELELIALNRDLAQKQLANVESLQPFQQELLTLSLDELRRQSSVSRARDEILTPDRIRRQAELEESIGTLSLESLQQDAERAKRLGPVQDELLQLQLDSLRRGGAATPEQIAQIKQATDAGIASGSADIDLQTQRGIGLISDELANSRGLRMTDTPILREATLLTRAGDDQKAGLVRNLRSAEMTARLNHPLAVQQIQSGINLNQQSVANNAQQFQAELRNRAYQNRLALTGNAGNFGIGLASISNGNGALNSLTQSRMNSGTRTTTGDNPANLQGIGSVLSGVGALGGIFSDRRLKDDYGVVGKTEGGINLHLYRYKGEDERDPLRLGVMADEVERVKPGAVKVHSSGYKVVDYLKVA